MIFYIYNIGVDLYNGFNGLRHRINWTYFTVLDGLAHPLYSATVMFSYDELCKKMNQVTELDVFNDVLDWKSHWIGVREDEIKRTIRSLLIFDWIQPEISFADDDELDL